MPCLAGVRLLCSLQLCTLLSSTLARFSLCALARLLPSRSHTSLHIHHISSVGGSEETACQARGVCQNSSTNLPDVKKSKVHKRSGTLFVLLKKILNYEASNNKTIHTTKSAKTSQVRVMLSKHLETASQRREKPSPGNSPRNYLN